MDGCGNPLHDLPFLIWTLFPVLGMVLTWLRVKLYRPKCKCGCGHEEGAKSEEPAR
jgi:hypothetical protein